jgi:hypothetical protein
MLLLPLLMLLLLCEPLTGAWVLVAVALSCTGAELLGRAGKQHHPTGRSSSSNSGFESGT